LELKT
jgi:hypothetical protein